MKRTLFNVGLRAEDMHGFIVGTTVAEYSDPRKTIRTVAAIGGLLKSDNIQLDSTSEPWEKASNYYRK